MMNIEQMRVASVPDLAGVLAYGNVEDEAVRIMESGEQVPRQW